MGLFVLGNWATSSFLSFSGFGGGRGAIRLETQLLPGLVELDMGVPDPGNLAAADRLEDSANRAAEFPGVHGVSWSRQGRTAWGLQQRAGAVAVGSQVPLLAALLFHS